MFVKAIRLSFNWSYLGSTLGIIVLFFIIKYEYNKKELLNYFIKFSPELKPNNSGFTPLSIAKQKGDMFLLKLLDKLNSC